MKNKAERLEQALRAWEDKCYTLQKIAELCQLGVLKPEDPVPSLKAALHWHEFRDYLLHSRSSGTFDGCRFLGASADDPFLTAKYLGWTLWLTPALFCWTRSSRRVFHISKELQALLGLTSLDGVAWDDIPWPFHSFVATLEEPLVSVRNQTGEKVCFDTVIVFSFNARTLLPGMELLEQVRFLLLDSRLGQRIPLSRLDREEMDDLFAKGKWRKLVGLLTSASKNLDAILGSSFYIDRSADGQVKIGETVAKIMQSGLIVNMEKGEDVSHWEAAVRIVAGLCLYLATLPPKSPHRSEWRPAEPGVKRPDPRAILTGAEVCSVSSVYKLTTEEKEAIERAGRGGYELSAHFRRGHWRRKPGYGLDPTAPKVVHVRPTLVRANRLPEGAVPGGSAQVIGS